jgi:hypothetical protein
VRERGVDAVDHCDRQDRVQPLEVRLGRQREIGHDVARGSIGAEVAAECTRIGGDVGQQARGEGAIDQQRLGGSAADGSRYELSQLARPQVRWPHFHPDLPFVAGRSIGAIPPIPANQGACGNDRFGGAGLGSWMTGMGAVQTG